MDTLNDKLQKSVQARKEKQKVITRENQKRKYAYAKELGFTPREAVTLQNWSMERINTLAKERGFLKE